MSAPRGQGSGAAPRPSPPDAAGGRLKPPKRRASAKRPRTALRGDTRRAQAQPSPAALDHISEPLRALAVPIGSLRADDRNVRLHDERNLAAIAASLQRFGQQAPVVYRLRAGRKCVLKGNGILAAARSLGWKHVAAVRSGLPATEARAFAIADNRSGDLSHFDEALLAAQLAELAESDVDIEAMGFTTDELQELLADGQDPAPAPQTPTGKKPGVVPAYFHVVVECGNEREQRRLFKRLTGEGLKCRLLIS